MEIFALLLGLAALAGVVYVVRDVVRRRARRNPGRPGGGSRPGDGGDHL